VRVTERAVFELYEGRTAQSAPATLKLVELTPDDAPFAALCDPKRISTDLREFRADGLELRLGGYREAEYFNLAELGIHKIKARFCINGNPEMRRIGKSGLPNKRTAVLNGEEIVDGFVCMVNIGIQKLQDPIRDIYGPGEVKIVYLSPASFDHDTAAAKIVRQSKMENYVVLEFDVHTSKIGLFIPNDRNIRRKRLIVDEGAQEIGNGELCHRMGGRS
jgi:hypothetical protein